MQNKCKVFAAVALLVISLSGCSNAKVPVVSPHDVLERAESPNSSVEIGTVGVYVDVTTSMKGFLNNPHSEGHTLYSLCLNAMGKQIASRYRQVTFYRVDTPLWMVVGPEDVLEQARNESYYKNSESFPSGNYLKIGEGDGYDSLCLTAALEEGINQDLFILITDLYENSTNSNTNVNTFISEIWKLADLDDGKVFGLIGIKSIFSGYIYDVGPDGSTIPYGMDSLSYRPFYILLRGYPEHVQGFCEDMEKRLNELGAQKEKDYEISVFYEKSFWGLDYTALKECANQLSPRKDFIWLDEMTVTVSDAKQQSNDITLPVYGYRKASGNIYGEPLYFTYSIDSAFQEEFHVLAEEFGENQTVDFLPGGTKDLCALPCMAQEVKASYWSEEKSFEVDGRENPFEVCGLYYDQGSEMLYVELRLADWKFTEGLWRLEWKNILKQSEADLNPWWEDWNSPDGANVDYSRTERLLDYMVPLLEEMPGAEQCILNGVVYLNIREN